MELNLKSIENEIWYVPDVTFEVGDETIVNRDRALEDQIRGRIRLSTRDEKSKYILVDTYKDIEEEKSSFQRAKFRYDPCVKKHLLELENLTVNGKPVTNGAELIALPDCFEISALVMDFFFAINDLTGSQRLSEKK